MSYALEQIQMGPGVEMWKPTADVLHDPNVQPQEPPSEEVFLGLPLGECGGVLMANQVITKISEVTGGPVYGNHVPTHGADANAHFDALGARFDLAPQAIPLGSPYVISAHGAAPGVAEAARNQGLEVFNVTCPLVERTHVAIRRAAAEAARNERPGHVAYISFGKRDHAELVGAAGTAEAANIPFSVVSTEEDVDQLIGSLPKDTTVTVVGQTTNNSEQADVLAKHLGARAKANGVAVAREQSHDVCHTVSDRQRSTREIVAAHRIGTLVVVGSVNSKNTLSLAKVAAEEAVARGLELIIRLVNSWGQLPVVEGRVGVISGASTLAQNVQGVTDRLAPVNGVTLVGEDTDKGITFMPVDVRTRRLLDSPREK